MSSKVQNDRMTQQCLGCCLMIALFFIAGIVNVGSAQPPEEVEVISPNGGETFAAGSIATIRWKGVVTGADSVKLEYTTDNGETWNLIHPMYGGSSYDWTVPTLSSERCRVRVTQLRGYHGDGDSLYSLNLSESRIRGYYMGFHNNGKILSVKYDSTLLFLNPETGQTLKRFDFGKPTTNPVFHPNGRYMAVGVGQYNADTPVVRIIDFETGETYRTLPVDGKPPIPIPWYRGDAPLRVSFSPDGKLLAVATIYNSATWDWENQKALDTLKVNGAVVQPFSFFKNGRHILCTYGDLLVYDTTTKKYPYTLSLSASIGYPTIAANQRWVTTSHLDSLGIWDIYSGEHIKTIVAEPRIGDQMRGQFVGDETRVMTWNNPRNEVRIWQIVVHNVPLLFRFIHEGEISDATANADGSRVATTQFSGKLIMRSIAREDISDATFAIGGPLPVLKAANLGSVKLGTQKDSTLQEALSNIGVTDLHVDSVGFVSGNTSDFRFGSNFKPVVVTPGTSTFLPLTFEPQDTGLRSVVLSVYTNAGIIQSVVEGVGTRGNLIAATNQSRTAYLGLTILPNGIDTVVSTFRNNGTAPLRIDSLGLSGIDRTFFEVVESPEEVEVGDTLYIRFKFTPDIAGRSYRPSLNVYDEYQRRFVIDVLASVQDPPLSAPEVPVTGSVELIAAILPNPAKQDLRITLNTDPTSNLRIRIADQLGRTVLKDDNPYYVDETTILLDLSSIKSGFYMIEVFQGGRRDAKAVVIQK